jgi:uncharacterized delta-60 repeat protein
MLEKKSFIKTCSLVMLFALCVVPQISLAANGSVDTAFNAAMLPNPAKAAMTSLVTYMVQDSSGNVHMASNSYYQKTNSLGTALLSSNEFNNVAKIRKILPQPDGKVILLGDFSEGSTVVHTGIMRLNADATLDTSFTTDIPIGTDVLDLVQVSDGYIVTLAAMSPIPYGSKTVSNILKLTNSWVLDTAFAGYLGGVGDGVASTLAKASDGGVIVYSTGSTTTYNGATVPKVFKISSAGVLDTAFNTAMSANATPNNPSTFSGFSSNQSRLPAVVVLADGDIYTIRTKYLSGSTGTMTLIRYNSDGTLDTGFNFTPVTTGEFSFSAGVDIAIDASQRPIVAYRDNLGALKMNRYSTAGAIDLSYSVSPLTANPIGKIKMLSNGDILTITGAQNSSQNIARYSSSGSFLGDFMPTRGLGYVPGEPLAVDNNSITFADNRVLSTGQIDTSYIKPVVTGDAESVKKIITSNVFPGKTYRIGSFTSSNGVASRFIARVNSDNTTADTTFVSGLGTNASNIGFNTGFVSSGYPGGVLVAQEQTDGKLIVYGDVRASGATTSKGIYRLNTDGSIDSTYNSAGLGLVTVNTGVKSSVRMWKQSNGKILLSHGLTTASYNGVNVKAVIRLNTDGTLDTTFGTAGSGVGCTPTGCVSGAAYGMVELSDGRIVLAGDFNRYGSMTTGKMIAIQTDGTLDTSFAPVFTATSSGIIIGLEKNTAGKIIVFGKFSAVNGTNCNTFAMFNSNLTLDTGFCTGIPSIVSLYAEPDTLFTMTANNYVYLSIPVDGYYAENYDTPLVNLARFDMNTIVTNLIVTGSLTDPIAEGASRTLHLSLDRAPTAPVVITTTGVTKVLSTTPTVTLDANNYASGVDIIVTATENGKVATSATMASVIVSTANGLITTSLPSTIPFTITDNDGSALQQPIGVSQTSTPVPANSGTVSGNLTLSDASGAVLPSSATNTIRQERLNDGTNPIALFSRLTNTSLVLTNVSGATDIASKKSFLHNILTAAGSTGPVFTLIVPRAPGDDRVVVCPGATSLPSTSISCVGAVVYTAASAGVDTDANYWYVPATGTGGISTTLAILSPAPVSSGGGSGGGSYSPAILKKITQEANKKEKTKYCDLVQLSGKGDKDSKKEDKGVTALQNYLIESGYMKTAANGNYGNLTHNAIKMYQKAKNLKVTGSVGYNTLRSIKKDCN